MVHAHWRQQLRQRRGRGALRAGAWLAAAALLMTAVGLALWKGSPTENRPAGQVVAVAMHSGTAPVQVGQEVSAGFELDTGQGQVALFLGGRTSVRLDRETSIRVLSPTSVALDHGTLYVDSGPMAGSMEVHLRAGL